MEHPVSSSSTPTARGLEAKATRRRRVESAVTSVSWIPSEAIRGIAKLPFELGINDYNDPPPDVIQDLEALINAGAFRAANELRAWIEVADGRVAGYGHSGRSHVGATKLRLGSKELTFPAIGLPTLRPEPEVGSTSVRFVQTAGRRASLPTPRYVRHPPFFQFSSAPVWTTLALTIHADGSSEFELLAASPFPRHWIYDHTGKLSAKTGLIDFKKWHREATDKASPWPPEASPVMVTGVESDLERELSLAIMRGSSKPKIRKLSPGKTLVEQGEPGDELFLLLDGVLAVEVDGRRVAEVGPGAILGERAVLEGGRRTSTLRALTPCRVAVARGDGIAPDLRSVAGGLGFQVTAVAGTISEAALEELARQHRREKQATARSGEPPSPD